MNIYWQYNNSNLENLQYYCDIFNVRHGNHGNCVRDLELFLSKVALL